MLSNGTCLSVFAVRVNSVGFLPGRIKTAVFSGKSADFSLVRERDDKVVFSGKAKGPTPSPQTEEELYHADFSEWTEEGEYFVRAAGGRSPSFKIARDAFESSLDLSMLALYGQRCGVAVHIEHDGDEFKHAACHLKEASLSRIGEGTRDDTGGWHDAGDYGKYAVNGAFAVAFLLKAYEHFPAYAEKRAFPIPERGGETPDLLDEARVELEWLLKVQLDDGAFSHKVTALNFEGTVLPEQDTQPRFFLSASSVATGSSSAALALGARLYAKYDAKFAERCLAAARKGQAWLDENPDQVLADLTGVSTGNYQSGGDVDERLWALAELWETTGEAKFLEQFESLLEDPLVQTQFDWVSSNNLALSTYLRSAREGRDPGLVGKIADGFVRVSDELSSFARADSYGRGVGDYYWGMNGVLARLSFNLIQGHFVQPHADYLDTIQLQLDHLLGKNVYGRSYITGLGVNPAAHPHHRPSGADAVTAPWPGLLIGGPHTRFFSEPEGTKSPFPALTWTDVYENYIHNEVAINWSTALTYALVAHIAAEEDSSPCESCGALGGAGGLGSGD